LRFRLKTNVEWSRALLISSILCLVYLGIDLFHFFIFGTKFTYIFNSASPTASIDFLFYIFFFGGAAIIVAFLMKCETRDIVAAGFIGPFLFLIVNYFIILWLLFLNPAYGSTLIYHWQWYWGVYPDWSVILPEVLVTFSAFYVDGLFLFLLFYTPFILAASFFGHAFGEIKSWDFL
jgi:hypothetical protein